MSWRALAISRKWDGGVVWTKQYGDSRGMFNRRRVFLKHSSLILDVRRGCVGVWDEAAAAARFVGVRCADDDAARGLDDALRVVGWLAAADADGVRLGDVLGDGE